MKREELLRSRDYWINEIQNELYAAIEEYMKKKKLSRTELANELGVSKGYVTQVLKGDFDHKISKMVDLAISSGKAPIMHFVDMDEYIKDDAKNKSYNLFAMFDSPSEFFRTERLSRPANSNYGVYLDIQPGGKIKQSITETVKG